MTKPTKMTQLLKGYFAPTALYNEILWYAKFGLIDMKPNTVFVAREVCGEICWDALKDKYWKRLAGRCFAHMVSTNQLPLEFVNHKGKTKRYQHK